MWPLPRGETKETNKVISQVAGVPANKTNRVKAKAFKTFLTQSLKQVAMDNNGKQRKCA